MASLVKVLARTHSSVPRVLASHVLAPVMHEAPRDAIDVGHQLMLRAGLMKQSSAGVYTLLPMAIRAFDKICTIINQEMHRIGGQRLCLPILAPSSLWEKSGRLQSAGPELITLEDRKKNVYVLSPTHEEVVTDLAASLIQSHRQLPLLLYQIDRKFRDELRPRSGLIRAKEFVMKDMYTFDTDVAAAQRTYNSVCKAYDRIFKRLSLPVVQALADTGNIGGSMSHEYHLLSDAGEDTILQCKSCGYAANDEKAECLTSHFILFPIQHSVAHPKASGESITAEDIMKSIEKGGLNLPSQYKLNVVWARDSNRYFVIVLRIEDELNQARLASHVCSKLVFNESSHSSKLGETSVAVDSIPSDSQVEVLVDNAVSVSTVPNNPRFTWTMHSQWRKSSHGDFCVHCFNSSASRPKPQLSRETGIELGHTFLLGTKYSRPFNVEFTDASGSKQISEMGCYGLGVTRILAATVHIHNDKEGIVWPLAVAPYRACIVSLGPKESTRLQAEAVYDSLSAFPELAGEVVLDASDRSAGIKLTESHLLGYPYIIVIGNRSQENTLEVKERRTGLTTAMTEQAFIDKIAHDLKQSSPAE